jgi:hypothetical protein
LVKTHREQGFVSLLGIAVVVLIASAAGIVAVLHDARVQELRLEERNLRLTALSDAVVAETLAYLAVDPAHRGFSPRPYGCGTIASRVVTTAPHERQLTGVVTWGEWSTRLEATIELMPEGPRVTRWQQVKAGPGTVGT